MFDNMRNNDEEQQNDDSIGQSKQSFKHSRLSNESNNSFSVPSFHKKDSTFRSNSYFAKSPHRREEQNKNPESTKNHPCRLTFFWCMQLGAAEIRKSCEKSTREITGSATEDKTKRYINLLEMKESEMMEVRHKNGEIISTMQSQINNLEIVTQKWKCSYRNAY